MTSAAILTRLRRHRLVAYPSIATLKLAEQVFLEIFRFQVVPHTQELSVLITLTPTREQCVAAVPVCSDLGGGRPIETSQAVDLIISSVCVLPSFETRATFALCIL